MVGLEDQLVALLQEEAERGGAEQLEERQPAAPEGGDGGADEQDRGRDFEEQEDRIHDGPMIGGSESSGQIPVVEWRP